MIIAGFLVQNRQEKIGFFEETSLLADISMGVVLGMFFLIFSNVDNRFAEKKPTWRSYTTLEALSITKRAGLIDK